MWSRRRSRPLTLAGQFLALQLVVLLAVLAVVSLVSLRQSDQDFRDTRGARLRATAESLAGTAAVQDGLEQLDEGGGGERITLSFYAQQRADDVGATAVYLADPRGSVVVGTDPTRRGEPVDLGPGTVLEGRSWTGDVTDRGRAALAAEVPIYSNDEGETPRLVGVAVVTQDVPSLADRVRSSLDELAVYLVVGLALGGAGSWLLARLIKRRTRGLEPAQIASLADQREALLTSIREGLVAVAQDGTLTVVSESARDLLRLPAQATGRRVADLDVTPGVSDLLTGSEEVRDAVVVVDARVLVVNRSRVLHDGRPAGTVTTLRDRTEMVALRSELDARESVTDTLRAQTHEFANQLHTISGLVQLEEYDELSRLVGTLARRRAEISDHVTARLDDPAVAALLIAKASLAAERRTKLVLSDTSRLPRLDPELSADVGTVLGNLVDNALDAASDGGWVQVHAEAHPGSGVRLEVRDDGPGVPPGSDVFRRGFTTKDTDALGRGVGLALVQVVCERRGGSVSVHNDGGAVFTALLPRKEPDAMREP